MPARSPLQAQGSGRATTQHQGPQVSRVLSEHPHSSLLPCSCSGLQQGCPHPNLSPAVSACSKELTNSKNQLRTGGALGTAALQAASAHSGARGAAGSLGPGPQQAGLTLHTQLGPPPASSTLRPCLRRQSCCPFPLQGTVHLRARAVVQRGWRSTSSAACPPRHSTSPSPAPPASQRQQPQQRAPEPGGDLERRAAGRTLPGNKALFWFREEASAGKGGR